MMTSARWAERSPRERRVIVAAAAVLALALAYAYVWVPVTQERERLLSDLPRLRLEAQQIRADAGEIRRLRAKRGAGAVPADVRAAIEAAARPLGLVTIDARPDAAGRLQVAFSSAIAGEWLACVAALQSEHGIRMESARIDARTDSAARGDAAAAGRLKVSATFGPS